jgi:hypothetical protein
MQRPVGSFACREMNREPRQCARQQHRLDSVRMSMFVRTSFVALQVQNRREQLVVEHSCQRALRRCDSLRDTRRKETSPFVVVRLITWTMFDRIEHDDTRLRNGRTKQQQNSTSLVPHYSFIVELHRENIGQVEQIESVSLFAYENEARRYVCRR